VCEVGLEASEAGSRKIAEKVKRVERRGLRRVYRGGRQGYETITSQYLR